MRRYGVVRTVFLMIFMPRANNLQNQYLFGYDAVVMMETEPPVLARRHITRIDRRSGISL